MVAIITGKGTGLERSSAFVLGSQGQLGSAALGRDGESVFVNAANGNLVVTRQDEFLIGLGPDVSIGRTYNSQSTISDGDNGDNWRASVYRKIQDLSGTYGAAATTVKRIDWDGSETLYTWNATESAYVATDGGGAYDKLTRSGDIWTWTDGNSRITELYDQTKNGLITTTIDADGNSLTYTYNSGSGLITRVTSLNGSGTDEYVDLTYDGTKLTQLLTTKSDGTLTRVRYTYDGSNRLSTVTVDLSPNDSAVSDGNKYVTTYTYHSSSTRVASIAQSDGSLLEISYVQDGSVYRVSSYAQTIAAGVVRTTSFDYSIAGRTTIIDPAGQKTVFHHDANGNLAAIAYPADPTAAARAVQFAYNANGDLVSATHGPGNFVTYGYDSRGNLVTERDGAGNLVWRTYGSKNELLTESRSLDWSPSVPTSSFETPEVWSEWAYNPTISGTTFTSTAGITGNGSAFAFAATTDGDQVAFVQSSPTTAGSISETIGGLKAGTRYVVAFSIAARPTLGGNPITVSFDGNALGTFMPSSTNFETIVVGFVATGTTGTLTFAGVTTASDVATAIDSVKVAEVQSSWFAYDSENHLRYALDGEGGVTQYSYHASGLLASTVELAGHTYTESGLRPGKPIVDTVLDTWVAGLSDKSSARRTDMTYDFRGGLDKVTSYAKLTSAGAFDTSSEKTETTYVYDQAGNLLSRVRNVSAAAETFVYDGLNRMTMATDFNANVTRSHFMDTLGQTVVTHANGLSEVSTYNRGGELISYSRSEAGANLVDLSGWPGNPGNVPSGYAIVPGWQNNSSVYDETRWQNTIGPHGLPVVAMQAGQLDASAEGGGDFTNEVPIDETKAYEFVYYFKLSDLDKHNVYFGMSGWGATAWVENATTGADDINPYFYVAAWNIQSSTFTQDKWYKVVGYVLPEGSAAVPAGSLGGVYDVSTGQKVADNYANYRWNSDRPSDTAHARFFDFYGEAHQQYSTYFYQPEIRQVTAPAAINPSAETSQYRYDNLGRLRMTIDPTGRRAHMMYDRVGRKVADIDADGSVIEYRYDGNDNLTSTTRYANRLSSGQLASLIDGNGNPTSAALSTLRPSSHADDSWTFQVYDRAQRLVQTIDGTGATTVYTYDSASQLVSTRNYANKLDATTLANLKAVASNPNRWSLATDGTPAASYNLIYAAVAPIDGAAAFQATIGPLTDWQAFASAGLYVEAGQTLTATITVKGVGSITSDTLGLYGVVSGWGANSDTNGLIVSGPGTITEAIGYGGYFSITGLSTTEATRVTISRTYWVSEWASPYFYLGDGAVVPGRSTIISAPVYTSESPHPILPTADAANDRTTRSFYDKDGRVIGTLDGAGGLTRFVYDKIGRKVTELGAAKAANSSLWATGTLAELVTSVGTSSSDRRVDYVYDARGFLRFTVDASARPIEMAYDAAGRVIRTISYAGSIASASTYSLAYVTAQLSSTGLATNAANRITRTVYNAAGQAMFGIDATDAVTAFTYDGVGKVTKQIAYEQAYALPGDPSLATMQSWATSQAGNALNRISRNVYDLMGRVAYQVDAENYVTENCYDRAGRVLKSIRYAGTYSVADGATKESVATLIGTPSGAVTTTYAYDADGLLSQTTDGTGAVTRFGYDALGRLTDTTVAYGTADASTTHRAYDVLGRATGETRAYGTGIAATTAFEYDSLGNLTKTTDALGHHTMRTYDRLGRVLSVSVPVDATPSNNLVTSYQYDAFGNAGVVTDARGSSSFTYYDALGRSTLHSDAEGYITQTSYTIFGEVYQVTRRALRGTGTPTLTAPPTIVTHADDATTTFEYDKNGRRLRATDALGYYDYTYRTTFGEGWLFLNKLGGVSASYNDRLGREYLSYVQGSVHNSAGGVEATGYYPHQLGLDSRGNVVLKYEAPGISVKTTTYVYDNANRLIQTNHPSVEIVGADLVTTSTAWPTETFTYNARGELILAVDVSGGKTHHYYDALGRKTWEVNAVGTLSQWSYDANGNVVSLKVYGDAVAIPTSPGGAPPTAPSSYRETTYEYDWAGRIKKTSVGTLLTGEYAGSAYATASAEVAATTTFYRDTGVTRETDARGNSTWTWHDRLGRELARVDRDNYLTVWTRDANGNALSETRHAIRITGSFSDATTVAGLQTLAGTNAADRVTNFTYDRNGRRLTETRLGVVAWTVSGLELSAAATSATITYAYNGLGQVTSRTEANGDLTTYVYDNAGRLTRTKGAAFVNNGGTNIRLQTDFFYDALGNAVRIVQDGDATDDASARITMSTYGAGGRLAKTTDAAGFERNFQYDAAGRVVKEWYDRTKADGTTVVREAIGYRYDLAGRLVTQAAAVWNGSAWIFGDATRIAYNAYGEVSGKGLTGGPNDTAVYQEQFFYDAGGRLWKSTAGDGAVKLMYYDKGGNLSLTLSSAGADLSGYTAATAAATFTSTGDTTIANAVTTILVFDKRGLQVQSREPDRQLGWNGSSFDTAELVRNRVYNAFGEVLSESDPRDDDWLTEFAYNSMGRLIEKKSPSVSWTSENGTIASARPTETYYYDLSGRMIGVDDANGNRTTRKLEAGTGHGGGEALVNVEYHADGGNETTWHNVFGDARVLIDALGQWEVRGYDNMGRVDVVIHRGNLISDYYAYDGLGRRIRHWNSQLGSSVVERTDYDRQGRVSQQIEMGGGTTTYAYAWNGTLATALGTHGGWVKTTTNASSLSATESLDYFGRTIARTDYGSHSYTMTFDLGARLTAQAGPSGQAMAYSWLNTGLLYRTVDTAGTAKNVITANYAYDAAGNRTYEGYAGTVYSFYFPSGTSNATQTLQNATIAYDALNRVTAFTDKDAGGTTRINVANEYDLAGNVRRVNATYPFLTGSGSLSSDKYYRYDAMNRMVLADGILSGGAIVRGSGGAEIAYDAAGRRVWQTRDALLTGQSWTWYWYEGHGPPFELPAPLENGDYHMVDAQYIGARREQYEYRADGSLANVKFAETGYDDNGDGTVTANGTYGTAVLRAEYTRDGMERIIRYREFAADGTTVTHDRYDIAYDNGNSITAETTVQKKTESGGPNTYKTITANSYTNGNLVSTTADTYKNNSDSALPDTSMAYTYTWYDGARIASTTYDKDTGSSNTLWDSTYAYDGLGRIASVDIDDGRPRTVSYAYTPEGQIVRRKERSSVTNNPEDQRYFVAGKQMGEITSDGNHDPSLVDYAQNINYLRNWTPAPQSAPFRWNTPTGVTRGTFGPSAGYDYINPFGQGSQSTGSRYTVRDGDTLQGIATSVWGDASLWYLIAEANGMAAGSALIAGQSLTLPDRVTNAHNNSGVFKVYDPNAALGDLSPTSAKPPKKPGACAVVGQIIMVAIAVGVTILTSGAAASLGPVLAGAIGGAAGSIASQAFGVATGLQSKFDWKGVAMGAIGGAVGGGLSSIKGAAGAFLNADKLASNVVRGALSSSITQGIGVATGLQDKFSWVGVATAGIIGGVSGAVTRALTPAGGPLAHEMAHSVHAGTSSASFAALQAGSAAGALAGAAFRSLATGTSFGDNLIAVLPDVIGSTIGNMMARGVQGGGSRGQAEEDEGPGAYEGDGMLAEWEESDSYLGTATSPPFNLGSPADSMGESELRDDDHLIELAALDLDQRTPGRSGVLSDFGIFDFMDMPQRMMNIIPESPEQRRLLRAEMNREWGALDAREQAHFRGRSHREVHAYLYDRERLPGGIYPRELQSLGAPAGNAAAWARPLSDAFARYGLISREQRAAFMGQAYIETWRLTRLDENLNYSRVELILNAFGDNQVATAEEARPLVGRPQALANHVYRRSNGNRGGSDGWNYRGRGFIQVTGRNSYAIAGYLDRPNDLMNPAIGAYASMKWWDAAGLTGRTNRVLSAAEYQRVVTRTVNAVSHAAAERYQAYQRALQRLHR